VASLRPAGWLIDAAIALAVLAAVGILTAADASSTKRGAVVAFVAVGAVLLLVGVVIASLSALTSALGALGVAAIISVIGHDFDLPQTVLVSVGLLLVWEIGSLAISERAATAFTRTVRWYRYRQIGAATAVGGVIAVVAGVAGFAGRGGGIALLALGAGGIWGGALVVRSMVVGRR
jgi:hypothetical protein